MYLGFCRREAQSIVFYVPGRLWEAHWCVFYVFGGGLAGPGFREPNAAGESGREGLDLSWISVDLNWI